MPVIVSEEGRSDVRTAPPLASCHACRCSIAGGASEALVAQFTRVHEGHDA